MLGLIVFTGTAVAVLVYIFVLPVIYYFYDSKVDKADHSCKRKRFAAAFATKNLERWEFKVAETTQRLLNRMDAHCTMPLKRGQTIPDPEDVNFDFGEWVYFFTIESINNIALSSKMGLMDKASDVVTAQKKDGTLYKARYREAQNNTALAGSVFVWDYKYFPLLVKLSKLSPKWRDIWKKGEPWGDIVYHQASTRLQRHMAGEKLDDFFASLMEDKQGNPRNLEWGEIVGEVGAIINAGADTTSIALTNVMELLLHNPQHLHTLRKEVYSALGEDEILVPYDKVKNLPFLRACLDEGLRISPPTSAGLPRRTPPEGAQILGQWIAGNTSVSMTIYAAHRDPDIFPDPEEYRPQRWMDPEAGRRMGPYFIPFSAGVPVWAGILPTWSRWFCWLPLCIDMSLP